jgi:formamidopyrimidine-DNA glycosylase
VPELPEVETIARGLRPALVGHVVRAVWTSGLPLRLARPLDRAALERICRGRAIGAVRRRGKYLLLDLEGRRVPGGAPERPGLIVHLGMSGRLRVQPPEAPREKHTHVVWTLDDGRELRFVDPRRFGAVIAAADVDARPEIAGLGPDPLADVTAEALAEALARSRAPIKAFLLDQRRVAGLGNIYVCEALFRAGVHPTTPARRLQARAGALVDGIRAALELGIENRGTTLRDYVDAEGGSGGNQAALLVYGREEAPCPRCGAPVRRRVDAGRSTFFCARCQRR